MWQQYLQVDEFVEFLRYEIYSILNDVINTGHHDIDASFMYSIIHATVQHF